MTFRGFLQPDKFLTQVGQLRTMTRDRYGATVVSTITTIPCLLYQDKLMQEQTAPVQLQTGHHSLILPNTVTVSAEDHITAVVDKFGGAVLDDGKIITIIEYNQWRHGTRFIHCMVERTKDPV